MFYPKSTDVVYTCWISKFFIDSFEKSNQKFLHTGNAIKKYKIKTTQTKMIATL